MNKTKRKIFETSLKLFSEKGYDATSIEEITATVGVAKGTLYYHFSSKEEIFNFLVEEGMKLLINSIEIKIGKCDNGDIVNCNAEMLASEIFSLTCSALIYRRKAGLEQIDVQSIYREYEKTLFNKIIKRMED